MSLFGWLVVVTGVLLIWLLSQPCGCLAIVVGRKATSDGSVLVGHNEENHGLHVLDFRKIPRRQSPPGSRVELLGGGSLEQVPETAAFLWSENPGLEWSDNYLNEHGVAIVSDGCPTREDSCDALAARGEIRCGGIGMMLRRLVAERARTARDGVRLVGDLVERFGYTSGRTYVVADSREAWLVALTRGRRWAARRVPDDCAVVLPNVYIFGELDLDDAENIMASADLVSYAIERGWFDPARGAFDFRRAYQAPDAELADPRQWWGQQLLTGRRDRQQPGGPPPWAVRPTRPLDVAGVAALLRNVEGPRPLFHPATQEMAVLQLRPNRPPEIGCVYWRTTGRPDTSVLTPWYAGIATTPPAYHRAGELTTLLHPRRHMNPPPGTFDPDPAMAWWKFATLQAAVDRQYAERFPVVRAVWDAREADSLGRQAAFDGHIAARFDRDRSAAVEELTRYCADQAMAACHEADRLAAQWRGGA